MHVIFLQPGNWNCEMHTLGQCHTQALNTHSFIGAHWLDSWGTGPAMLILVRRNLQKPCNSFNRLIHWIQKEMGSKKSHPSQTHNCSTYINTPSNVYKSPGLRCLTCLSCCSSLPTPRACTLAATCLLQRPWMNFAAASASTHHPILDCCH